MIIILIFFLEFPEEAPKTLGYFNIALFSATNLGYVPFQSQWLAQDLTHKKPMRKMVNCYCVSSPKAVAPLNMYFLI